MIDWERKYEVLFKVLLIIHGCKTKDKAQLYDALIEMEISQNKEIDKQLKEESHE